MNFKKTLTLLSLLLFTGVVELSAATIYVDLNATGANNGSSWIDAYTNLQTALAAAGAGDEIWVSQGTYYADLLDETISFELDSIDGIYGGFDAAGMPMNYCDADPMAFPTILSGEINNPSLKSDNTERIILVHPSAFPMVIDGFTIVDGYADGGGARSQGAAIHCVGGGGGPLSIRRCTITGNHADDDGGGIYAGVNSYLLLESACSMGNYMNLNDASRGGAMFLDNATTAHLNDTEFEENVADQGGANYYSQCGSIDEVGLTFTGNYADDGGAIYDDGTPSLNSGLCIFNYNFANDNGGAVYSTGSFWNMNEPNFTGNQATNGGGIYATAGDMTVGGPSNFVSHRAQNDGGAIYFDNMILTHVGLTHFDSNAADSNGGAIYVTLSTVEVVESNFAFNTALKDGGAIHFYETDMHVTETDFYRNSSLRGGAMYIYDGTAAIFGTHTYERNMALDHGGAICAEEVANGIEIGDATFIDNQATEGGAVHITNSEGNIGHCTLNNNEAYDLGGGVALFSCNPFDINNSYFDTNLTPSTSGKSGGNVHAENSTVTAGDCTFSSGESYIGGGIALESCDWHSNNCDFANNVAKSEGGGIYADATDLLFEGDEFSANYSAFGGGIYLKENCTMTMRDGTAFENTAKANGGFIRNETTSDVYIGNLYAITNIAGIRGGVFSSGSSSANFYIANMMAVCNYADSGNIYHSESGLADLKLYFASCLDNVHIDGAAQITGRTTIQGTSSNSLVSNSIFWRNQQRGFCGNQTVAYTNTDADHDCSGFVTSPWPGTGNIATTPRFIDPDGFDNTACSLDDDLRLNGDSTAGINSLCIDTGSADTTLYYPMDFADVDYDGVTNEKLPIDILGANRIHGSKPDLGAYENDGFYKRGETPVLNTLSKTIVFPNPTTDRISVLSGAAIQQVRVFNLNGQLLEAGVTISNGTAEVNLSDLRSGVYLLRITDAKGETTHQVQKL